MCDTKETYSGIISLTKYGVEPILTVKSLIKNS